MNDPARDTIERQFPIPQLAVETLLVATSVAAALLEEASALQAKANAITTQATQPILAMLGIEDGAVLRFDRTEHGPVLTVRVPTPKRTDSTLQVVTGPLPTDEEIAMMPNAPKAES